MSSLVLEHDVLWVSAAMSRGDRAWARQHEGIHEVQGFNLHMLRLEQESYAQYYNTISNPYLWFVQHELWDVSRTPVITQTEWDAWQNGYVEVNRAFADSIADQIAGISRPILVMPQDYHLYLVPKFLRERLGDQVVIQPFIHIPWPSPDAWRVLPSVWRNAIFESLLHSDRIGFQTEKDAFNFAQTCHFYMDDSCSMLDTSHVCYEGHTVEVTAYPISIDVEQVENIASLPNTSIRRERLKGWTQDRKLILRVDRIEPSKNILRGLIAYRRLLERHPEHRGKVQMLALLVPSRMEIDEYQTYLRDVMAEAGMINARFSTSDWEPIRITIGDNYARAVAAMQLYDVLLVNPITDGMNLVAKEGSLVNQRNGVLLLSEYAGAFFELGEEALVISPFDIHSTVEAMHQALTMPSEEREQRAKILRAKVKQSGVKQWLRDQVEDALRSHALRESSSQLNSDSTPATPSTRISAASSTV